MQGKQTAEQVLDDSAALFRKGSLMLVRLEQARLSTPQSPALTSPEWELLAAFGLVTVDEVRQRMNERAMLAAYDGAPSSLTELRVERASAAMGSGCGPGRAETRVETKQESVLETSVDYDPEGLRASVRYIVTRRQYDQTADREPLETEDSRFHAVTIDVRTGGVVQREYGTSQLEPGHATARQNVVREAVAQPVR